MPHHRRLRRWLPLAAAGVLLHLHVAPAAAQWDRPAARLWSASEVVSHLRGTVTESMGQTSVRRTPPAGSTLLEVRALFATTAGTPAAIQADSIYLASGPGRQGGRRFPLESIGVVGRADACVWSAFAGLLSGAVTITFESGDGYSLSRPRQRGPLAITFQRNPNRTCLLFAVPSGATAGLRLRVAGSEWPVTPTP
jgi:hypothetical protein